MIRTISLLAVASVCLVFACKKDKNSSAPSTSTPPVIDSPIVVSVYDNYTQLTPGNYWIYQDYMLDSATGAAHPQGTFDSSYVEKDTTINGKVYHKYLDVKPLSGTSHPEYDVSFLRDSLSYTVNEQGIIKFSSQDFSHTFRSYTYGPNSVTPDTIKITEQMGFPNASVTVEAGTFVTSTMRRILRYPSNYRYGPTREYDYCYSKKIGLIKETTAIFDAIPQVYERRLVRYHVK